PRSPRRPPLFPYTTLFRSVQNGERFVVSIAGGETRGLLDCALRAAIGRPHTVLFERDDRLGLQPQCRAVAGRIGQRFVRGVDRRLERALAEPDARAVERDFQRAAPLLLLLPRGPDFLLEVEPFAQFRGERERQPQIDLGERDLA